MDRFTISGVGHLISAFTDLELAVHRAERNP
jgi:hypothetical protein